MRIRRSGWAACPIRIGCRPEERQMRIADLDE